MEILNLVTDILMTILLYMSFNYMFKQFNIYKDNNLYKWNKILFYLTLSIHILRLIIITILQFK